MRKSILYPALALGLGAIGAGLRMWQRAAGYDMTGLPVPFAAQSILLALFLLLCGGAAVYAAMGQDKTLEDQSAALPKGPSAGALLAAAGALILLGGIVSLLLVGRAYLRLDLAMYATAEERSSALRSFLSTNLLPGILALASVPTAAALLLRAKDAQSGRAPRPFPVMMPPIFCWLWLIEVYRQHTSNPILWDYVLLLLASVALLISGYERAGFAFGIGKPRRTVFTSLAGLMLAVAALPDCGGAASALILLALALHTAVELHALLGCFEYRPKRLAPDGAGVQIPAAPEDAAPREDDAQSTQQEDAPHE